MNMILRKWTSAVTVCAAILASLDAVAEEKPLRRIAFGSCAHQDFPQPIWDSILPLKPDAFLLIGDNIYGDTRDMNVLRAKYDKLAAVPAFELLRRATRMLATWDDHDYGENDAGLDYPMRAESQQVFLDFMGVSNDSPRRKQQGVYDAAIFGPEGRRTQIILLDTRYFRSPLKRSDPNDRRSGYVPDSDPEKTMLGEAQWLWLEQQLRQPAELRLVVSSIQVVPEDHHWEKWMNFPRERERLFRIIRETQAAGVIFLSGDRHLAELSMMNGGVGYPLYDLTSSGLNRGRKTWRGVEVNRHRVATMSFGDNFGLIDIEWDAPESRVSLQIRDVDADIILQQKIPLAVLQPGTIPE